LELGAAVAGGPLDRGRRVGHGPVRRQHVDDVGDLLAQDPETLLGRSAVGDVLGDPYDPDDVPVLVEHGGPPVLDPADPAVGPTDPVLLVETLALGPPLELLEHAVAILGQDAPRPAPHIVVELG